MNLKYEVGQEVAIEAPKTITEIKTSEIKSITVCKTGAKYLTSDGAFSEEQLDAFAKCAPQQDKPTPKFKVGDKARIIGNTTLHHFPTGEIVRIVAASGNTGVYAEYLDGCGGWCVHFEDLEPYTEPEQEPIKLYCVKDFFGFGIRALKKGKVYEFDGHRVNYDGMECAYHEDFEAFKCDDPGFAACLVPLVKRPAKVGEWVYVTGKRTHAGDKHNYKVNEIYKVFQTGEESCVWFANDSNGNVIEQDYLVLDGCKPEYYNGEVVCVEKSESEYSGFTIGKVYKFKDGEVIDDDDTPRPMCGVITSLDDGYAREWANKFIPYKGKSNADK